MTLSIILVLIIIILLGILVFRNLNVSTENPGAIPTKTATAILKGKTYNLEIADTAAARQTGLMNRTSLSQNSGMLFIFEGSNFYPFWMKDTYIPLDIIWLNQNKEVVYIKENAQPCSNTIEAVCNTIVPTARALYVIELNAGEVNKQDLQVGDKIEFELPN